jgi:hypothetical protein
MRHADRLACVAVVAFLAATSLHAQTTQGRTTTTVPRLVRVTGTLNAGGGVPAPAEIITFAIYADENGGTPLWQETQNVVMEASGHYTALLGSTSADGLPLDVFTASDARWLGVHVQRVGAAPRAVGERAVRAARVGRRDPRRPATFGVSAGGGR